MGVIAESEWRGGEQKKLEKLEFDMPTYTTTKKSKKNGLLYKRCTCGEVNKGLRSPINIPFIYLNFTTTFKSLTCISSPIFFPFSIFSA